MLSQIRQISDGNHNTVFVKNKEQKFNLDKEIHDLECWKQSRNHVYRKEERELLNHLDKLKQQQEYLHHLDEERSGHVRGSQASTQRRHSTQDPIPLADNASVHSPSRRHSTEEMDPHTTPVPSVTPIATAILPPVKSGTDKRALHRTDAHTNICLICQLPKWSHGRPSGEEICCCDHEGMKSLTRRYTTTGYEAHGARNFPPPIQIGQRRHSLMMARLNENQHEHQPHPPEHGYTGKDEKHSGDHLNKQQDHIHIHRHVHNHVHMHHDTGHHDNFNRHQHQMEHANSHRGHVQKNTINMHGAQGPHIIDHHGHHSSLHERAHHKQHTREHTGDRHASENQRHDYHGNHAAKFTPSNSPRRYSRQSFTHNEPQISQHDPMHHNGSGHRNYGRRHSTIGSFGYSAQQSDTRTRDHELHWDRHQVCQLKGMITDPHYKEQLEVESGGTYPWSGLYAPNNVSIEDINNMKNCRYLRFSKLNLMNMKENPEEEVEVFEKNQLPE